MNETFTGRAVGRGTGRMQGCEPAFPVAPDFENRMRDQLGYEAAPAKLANHRIQKKWHIVVDDIDNEEVRILERAVAQNNLGLAGGADVEAFEGASRKQGQGGRIVSFELPRIHLGKKLFREARGKLARHALR